jgi:SPP1 gp7 family putative phage head morphogenesis protein
MPWARPWTWQDAAAGRAASAAWRPSKAAERRYAEQLRSVATQVTGLLAQGQEPRAVQRQLRAYAQALDAWARQAATNMVGTARRHNEQGWRAAAQRWGIDLRAFLEADIEQAVQDKVEANILLIKSLPFHAAQRVGELAQRAVVEGTRAETLARQIVAQGEVTQARARTIAHTEVSKAQTALTQARAQGVGSEGYIWRTTRDGQRRSSHAAMEGRFVRWDQPPTLDGMVGHAGETPNCRCYPEPVVPDAKGRPSPSPLPTQAQERQAGEIVPRSHWERQGTNPLIPHQPGTPLHNVDRARFAASKLTNYSMDPTSPRGRDKARVWQAALGMDKGHAQEVERQIMARLAELPAVKSDADEYGERYSVFVPVTGPNGRTVDVLSAWIYERDKKTGAVSTVPRMINCYVPRQQ